MVRKCCVPQCKSDIKFIPSHRLPKNLQKAKIWLEAIKRTDLINASSQTLNNLRICTLHFSDDCIVSYAARRNLKDCALPTLQLPSIVNEQAETSTTISNFENVDIHHPVVMPIPKCKQVNIQSSLSNQVCRKKLRQAKKLLYKKKIKICKQRKEINKFRKKNKWEEITTDFSSVQRIFLDVIKMNLKRKPEMTHGVTEHTTEYGHRYDTKQKALALTLYKTMGKHAYTCLREVFPDIPCIQSLQLMLQKIPLAPGLNSLILRHLKITSRKMSSKNKVCILMWDVISIQSNITYDTQKDIICGFEDWGNKRTNKLADHVLVFMLRGLNTGWKMPISYNFCTKATNNIQLVCCIKEHVHAIHEAGFHIVATVCDQGSPNICAMKQFLLQMEMERHGHSEGIVEAPIYKIGNYEIVHLFDAPHLIKCLRNSLLTKDLAMNYENNIPSCIASWNVIKTAWIMDRKINTIRPQLKKITKEHVIEKKIKKMRVKYATQVLSGTVASCIEIFARLKCVVTMEDNSIIRIDEKDGITTAKMINFFNDLFDSVNGTATSDNELRCEVTVNSAHHVFWTNAKNVLRNMCYIDKITRKIVKTGPTLKNWLLSIQGFQKLWEILKCKYDFTSLKTRYCNQDPIENFFGKVRSHAVRNTNPTPRQFEDSFITLLVNDMKSIKIADGNCEVDEDSFMLHSLEKYLESESETELEIAEVCNISENNDNDESPEMEQVDVSNEFLSDHRDNIISVIKRQFNNCEECESSLRNNCSSIFMKQVVYRILKLLQTRSHQRNILKVLLQHFENWTINMDWNKCVEHRANIFMTMVRVIAVKILAWWCNKKNFLMRNADDDSNVYYT